MDHANVYEESAFAFKIVQIKILEVLFRNEIRHLVYMRDITSILAVERGLISQENPPND